MYEAIKKRSQEKRGSNREQSTNILTEKGVIFESKNNGAHLVIQGNSCVIDFWPGTGRWITRQGTKGFGVFNLLNEIGDNLNE